MAGRIGLEMNLMRNTGTPGDGSPSWDEVTVARDVTVNLETGEADISTRASIWRTRKATLLDGTLDFQVVYDPDDTHYAALETAFLAKSLVDLAAVDDGGDGLRFVGNVFNFSRSEPLEDAVVVDVSVRPDRAVTQVTGISIS